MQRIQKLKSYEYSLIKKLVDSHIANEEKIAQIITQVVKDRIRMASDKFNFAQNIVSDTKNARKIIISLNYYAMYQAARALVFLVNRNDVDDHDQLANKIGKILGKEYEDTMSYWRKARNEVDYSAYPILDSNLAELSRQSIIRPR